MARIRDIPVVWRRVGLWELLKRVYQQVNEDNLLVWASALAYSWLFAIFPFILILMSLVPYLPKDWRLQAREQVHFVVAQLPLEMAKTVWTNVGPRIDRLLNTPPRGLLSIGIILTLWAASGGVNMTMSAIDKCYEVTHVRPFYKQRPLAIGLTLIIVTMTLLVLILMPIGTVVTNWMMGWLVAQDLGKWMPLVMVWQVLRYVLGLVLMLAVLEVVYHYGPNVKQRWHWVTPGAAFTVVVWLGLGWVFRLYIDKFGKYNETYGTVGGVAILLLFFYIDSVVLLVGAEINSEIDKALDQLPPEGAGVEAPIPDSGRTQTGNAEGNKQGVDTGRPTGENAG